MKKSLVLFEDDGFVNLLPLVYFNSIFELRLGRKIVLDRAAQLLGLPVAGVWTREWIAPVAAQRCGAPVNQPATDGAILVNGRWLMDETPKLPKAPAVGVVDDQVAFVVCDKTLSGRLESADLLDPVRRDEALQDIPRHEAGGRMVRYPWNLVLDMPGMLERDWRPSDAVIESDLKPKPSLVNTEAIHVGEGTRVHPTAVIDASKGPVYISHDVSIGPYAVVEGPIYVGPGSRIMAHAWLHGGNGFGPMCKVGGEVFGSILHGYANKQHLGFLGHSYVGSWVNIGAGATNSNLKNTYGKIRVPVNGRNVETGAQFFGAVIGDHAKLCINASIPTGAWIGLGASVATTRLLPQYIPSFSWVTEEGVRKGDHLRLVDVAAAAMIRRDVEITDDEVELMIALGERAHEYEARAKR